MRIEDGGGPSGVGPDLFHRFAEAGRDLVGPAQFVVTVHKANGNAEVGEMWTETHVVTAETSIGEIWDLLGVERNRVILTPVQPLPEE